MTTGTACDRAVTASVPQRGCVSDMLRRKPITGMAGRYARAASGHPAAVSGLIELAPRMLRWTDLRMRFQKMM
jgi:hypothetical protein